VSYDYFGVNVLEALGSGSLATGGLVISDSSNTAAHSPQVLVGPVEASNMNRVLIGKLNNRNYFLKKPILLTLENAGDEYIAGFPEAELVTSGETEAEAIRWLETAVVSKFKRYRAERNSLGPLPRRQLKVLEQYIGTR
jgi:hypothetical protein